MKNIEFEFTTIKNVPLSHKTWLLKLYGDTSAITAPGQFVNIKIPGKYLRRPISICNYFSFMNDLTLLYDVVGEGTEILSRVKIGDKLNLLVGLGNGFNLDLPYKRPFLLGGGIGCAPLYNLALQLKHSGKEPIVILGYNTAGDSCGVEDWIKDMNIETYIATVDGSKGTKGFVTDVIREKNLEGNYFYACGPMPMLKALCTTLNIPGEVSIESRMGCGFGACMCCSVETVNGAKRICKDGPVFKKEELLWK